MVLGFFKQSMKDRLVEPKLSVSDSYASFLVILHSIDGGHVSNHQSNAAYIYIYIYACTGWETNVIETVDI